MPWPAIASAPSRPGATTSTPSRSSSRGCSIKWTNSWSPRAVPKPARSAQTPMIPTQRLRHDLRTPVNHLLGYSQLLIEDAQESGFDDGTALFERIAALGKDILRQIELSLPSTETTAPEQRLVELRELLEPRLGEINQTLDSLPCDKSSPQFADVQR